MLNFAQNSPPKVKIPTPTIFVDYTKTRHYSEKWNKIKNNIKPPPSRENLLTHLTTSTDNPDQAIHP